MKAFAKVCLALIALLASLNSRAAAANLTVNGTQTFQTVDGYGVNVNALSWDGDELKPALDLLVDQLGATIFRTIIDEMDWEATNDNSDPNVFNWSYYNAIYSSPKFEKFWSTLRYLNRKGIEDGLMLSFMGQAPPWMGPNFTITQSNEDELVEMLASVAYYARYTAGIRFTLYAPINEPNWDDFEGPRTPPAQYARILNKLALKLDTLGLSDVRFVGPDGARQVTDLQDFGAAIMAYPNVMAKMHRWALHTYTNTIDGAQQFISASAFPNMKFWVTETANFADVFGQIQHGPSANFIWEAYESVYNHAIRRDNNPNPPNDLGNGPALLAYNTTTRLYTPQKVFYEYAQLYKFVTPGSIRIGATDNDTNLSTYAFRNPATGRLTIVGRNTGGSALTLNGTLANLPANPATLEFHRTNSTLNLARGTDVAVAGSTFSVSIPSNTWFTLASPVPKLDTHEVRLDGNAKLLSWRIPQDQAYAHVAKRSADFIKAAMIAPVDPGNGLPAIYTHSEYDPDTFVGSGWPNNPGSKNAMLADSMLLYYAYSGDAAVLTAVQSLLDYHLSPAGTTPANYYWANVPWSTGAAGSPSYGNDSIAEGAGILEPDKIGELGFHGYLRFYQITGLTRYRDAAIACADALALRVRVGSVNQSPWPFRANAQTGALGSTPEDYCASVAGPLQLFDELIRLNLGNVAAYQTARTKVWNWMMTYPMVNNNWANYFEDDPPQTNVLSNTNGYTALQVARYLIERPDLDPNWQTHATGILNWVETTFGGTDNGEPGLQYGARTISEQQIYKFKMASHTGRWAAVCALLAEKTGDPALKDKAFRSLNWCSYMARNTGSVIEGPFEFIQNRNNWYTDGHGDYIRHFMLAMGAAPEWAPAGENRLLRSSSVVKSIAYNPGNIAYTTFDAASTETLRMAAAPLGITANGNTLTQRADLSQPGWTFDPPSGVLRIRHDTATNIIITFNTLNTPPGCSLTSPAANANVAAPASILLTADAGDTDGSITKVEFFNGATKLGEDTTAPYHHAWNNITAGTYTLTALATDNRNSQTSSQPATLTVGTPASIAVGSDNGGNTFDTMTDNTGSFINASRFQATRSTSVTSIMAKVGAITGSYRCAIYEDFNGTARNLLRQTSLLTNVTVSGPVGSREWKEFPLTSALGVTSGTYYWLAIWSDDQAARIAALDSGQIRFAAYPIGSGSNLLSFPSPVDFINGTGHGTGTFTYSIHAVGAATANAAPTVNAGANQTITLPASAALSGAAGDDGQPGALVVAWNQESGPGTVTFGNPNALGTTASFTVPGNYTLRLTASDGAVTKASDITLTVNAALTPLETWRQTYFGTTANTGTAADLFDFDQDGAVNLLEYALGTIPTDAASVALPTSQISSSTFETTYLRARSDVTYLVERSTDLAIWTATGVTQATTPVGQPATASTPYTPATAPSLFLRLKVTQP